ncbi:sigma-70 family RNA polymerase sigma factor [candidate division WOR-3 bacterium]|nr:sigma-70 family RNA polymerase sigma factor [candidate division WOR-3 bacterium]
MSGNEDAHLVKAFKKGDEEAFDRIFEIYRVPIYSICYRFTRNDADARDLTQEVFIKVYRNLKNFNERSKLFTWVYRITVNTCISFKRRESRPNRCPRSGCGVIPLGRR